MPVITAGAEESAAFVALALLAAYEHGRRCAGEVAKVFGVTRNQVSQAKVRLGRMIEAVEAEFGD